MLSIKNIVYATDFSPAAHAALPIACALARDYGARLTLVHVRPRPEAIVGEFGALSMEPGESKESLLARMRRLAPADSRTNVALEVCDGDAATEILASAARAQADVIVLGTHGRSGVGRLLLGSVAETVLREARCPVLTIRAAAPAPVPAQEAAPAETARRVEREELATVCSVANPAEAEIIQLALKGEGIRSFAEGSQQAGLVGMLGIPIRIQVPADDFDRASKIIRKGETAARRR